MKIQSSLFATLLLGSAMFVGCEQSPEARPADRTTTTTTTTDTDYTPTTPPVTTTPPRTTTTPPATTTDPMGTSGTMDNQRVQTLIDRARQQINDKQFDQAEMTLTQIESMNNLSTDVRQQVQELRDDLREAREGSTPTTTPPASTPPATTPN